MHSLLCQFKNILHIDDTATVSRILKSQIYKYYDIFKYSKEETSYVFTPHSNNKQLRKWTKRLCFNFVIHNTEKNESVTAEHIQRKMLIIGLQNPRQTTEDKPLQYQV